MEERKLNEKESLELITRMIQNTKDRMAENSGTPFFAVGICNGNYLVAGLVLLMKDGQ